MLSVVPSTAISKPVGTARATEGYIHSVETSGTVDGPGIRFVVFVSGCPLRCIYCHNPDTREKTKGELRSVASIVDEAQTYKDFILRTGGGVTVSGGEPLYQPEFLLSLLESCKAAGLPTALDTSGYTGRRVDTAILDATDLVLLDIKSFDPDIYQRITKHKLEPTLEFARLLAERKQPMWVRLVVIPELNDDMRTYAQLADFLMGLGNVERVETLPFHKMGEHKWHNLQMDYELTNTQPPSDSQMKAIRQIFESRGLVTV